MIRLLGLWDVPRIAALRAADIAELPLGAGMRGQGAFHSGSFILERLRYRRTTTCFLAVENGRLVGVASVRKSSGPTAWHVDHLALVSHDGSSLCELLGAASSYATRRGAQRLFLHLPDEWDIQKEACRSGFTVSTQVLLLTLPGRCALSGDSPDIGFRPRQPSDDLALFRLYNASTPAEVRYKVGLILEQWKDAQPPKSGSTRELVLAKDGEIKAWLRLDRPYGWMAVRMVVHPDYQIDMQSVIGYLSRAGMGNGILWEVPEYQGWVHLPLERMGFEVSGCYRLLVNSLAPMVKESAWAPAPTSV